jgi:hypothetical protein
MSLFLMALLGQPSLCPVLNISPSCIICTCSWYCVLRVCGCSSCVCCTSHPNTHEYHPGFDSCLSDEKSYIGGGARAGHITKLNQATHICISSLLNTNKKCNDTTYKYTSILVHVYIYVWYVWREIDRYSCIIYMFKVCHLGFRTSQKLGSLRHHTKMGLRKIYSRPLGSLKHCEQFDKTKTHKSRDHKKGLS